MRIEKFGNDEESNCEKSANVIFVVDVVVIVVRTDPNNREIEKERKREGDRERERIKRQSVHLQVMHALFYVPCDIFVHNFF